MKAARMVLEYLRQNGVKYIFGIPAGSVNAFFDELYEMDGLEPVVTKHEGAASYMAAAYAKYSGKLSVSIGCSGPGGTNLVTGAANAMREHLPVLFITGAVPVQTMGHNASQELEAAPIFQSITKYSAIVKDANQLLSEVEKACRIALSGVPGPVHIAVPIDVSHADAGEQTIPFLPDREPLLASRESIEAAVRQMRNSASGCILVGQGVRGSVHLLVDLAERLGWPIVTTPQAKGYIPDHHPLLKGVFGFAGHSAASDIIADSSRETILIVGSSLGETATNNYNASLTKDRVVIQLDFDETVFNRKYQADIPVLGDIENSLSMLLEQFELTEDMQEVRNQISVAIAEAEVEQAAEKITEEYNTQNVLRRLQQLLPQETRYTVDIGEFMSYVIQYMNVVSEDSFSINVHFGAMGSGIGSAIGAKLAEPNRTTVCLTGDGCFFMHGMEVLTAKEYHLPILFVVVNNARLGMVYHGHRLQFKRTHPSFEQAPVAIANLAEAMGIPNHRVEKLEDLTPTALEPLLTANGPAVLEIAIVDNNTPPMGDRVKFLSSFGK